MQQVVGKLSAAAFGAPAAVLEAVDELARTLDGRHQDPRQLDASELAAAQAQAVVIELVLDATSELFEIAAPRSRPTASPWTGTGATHALSLHTIP